MALTSGEYPATLDDRGRISIPAKFRENLPGSTLVLAKGIERCVWAFTPQQWDDFSSQLRAALKAMSFAKADVIQHQFLFSVAEQEIDKLGRVAVPQSLRDYAALSKDCTVMSNGKRIELWDNGVYAAYQERVASQVVDILEGLDSLDL
jgi:MraZ protein